MAESDQTIEVDSREYEPETVSRAMHDAIIGRATDSGKMTPIRGDAGIS